MRLARDLCEAWVAAGQDYLAFWDRTVSEVFLVLKATGARAVQEIERARALNHELAVLISYAHHNPAKMPKYRPHSAREADQAAAQEQVRGWFMAKAMASKTKKARAGQE